MENRVPVVRPAVTPEQTFQSFMLRPDLSAQEILTSDLSTVHWEHKALGDGMEFTHRDAPRAAGELIPVLQEAGKIMVGLALLRCSALGKVQQSHGYPVRITTPGE